MPNEPADNNDPADTPASAAATQAEDVSSLAADDDPARELTEALNRAGRDMTFANSQPRDAATLIMIDRSGETPKVLLGRRHERHKFMPGKFVFPGGRVEAADRAVGTASELDARVTQRLMIRMRRPSPAKARAYAVAAIRETVEETGLVLGPRADEHPAAPPGRPVEVASTRLYPDLAAIHLIARAITPPRRPRRFDTRFFALDAQAIAGQVEGVVGPESELIELVWLPLTEAERLDMPPITQAVLGELENRIASGFSHDLPVPFYRWVGRRFVRSLL